MIEFVRVDHAVTNPFTCVCGSHTGPFTRTFYERWGDEIYICESCAMRIAKTHGLVKGARQMQLINSARLLDAKEREVAEVTEQRDAALAEIDVVRAVVAGLEAELEGERGKVAQFEHLLGAVKERLEDPTVPKVPA